jgi:hypothetical protein
MAKIAILAAALSAACAQSAAPFCNIEIRVFE